METVLAQLDEAQHTIISTLRRHPFLRKCRDGELSLEGLKVFLTQQGLYSRHFTRYLCSMMSNLLGADEIKYLAGNFLEELGLDEEGSVPHGVLYTNMLTKLGLDAPDSEALLPGTSLLINTMMSNCRDSNPLKGLAALCLGAEALVPAIYTDILAGLHAAGVDAADTLFFRLHVECDDGHAEAMRDVMASRLQKDPAQIAVVLEVAGNLLKARLAFFDDIDAGAGQAVYNGLRISGERVGVSA